MDLGDWITFAGLMISTVSVPLFLIAWTLGRILNAKEEK